MPQVLLAGAARATRHALPPSPQLVSSLQTSVDKASKKEYPMTTPADWCDLRDKFLAALGDDLPEGEWLVLWRLFVEHPWYQEQLDLLAGCLVRRLGGVRPAIEDVKQDAILVLARKLRSTPDLHIDRDRAQHHFAGWMATIIRSDCLEALRRLRKPQPLSNDVVNEDRSPDRSVDLEARIDLSMLLDQLPDPQRTIVILHHKGWQISEIADELKFSYWKVRRLLQDAFRILAIRIQVDT